MPLHRHARVPRRYAFVDPRWLRLFRALDGIGDWVVPRHAPVAGIPTRLLLVNLAHLGDVVLATAAIRTARAARPDARLSMLVSPVSARLLDGHPSLDEVIEFDAAWWGRSGGRRHIDPGGISRLTRILRAGRYDLVIQLKSFFQENLAAALARVPRRVGFGIYGGGFLQTDEVAYPWDVHTVEQNAALLAACGMPDPAPQLDVRPRPQDEEAARLLLAGMGDRLSALHLGAGTPAKQWPLTNFVAVGEWLSAQGYRVVLVGGPDDAALVSRYRDAALHDPVDACARLHPLATAAVLRRCAVFVGADSAPAHLAAAVGVPTVVVFSGTGVSARWRPWGDRVELLETRPPCAPCGLPTCPLPGHDCMTAVTPGDVQRAIDRLLTRTRSRTQID